MQGDTILLKEVLAWMDSGRPFDSIRFVTANHKTGKGGELIELHNCRKHNWLSPQEWKKQQALQPASKLVKKDPRHYENSTRNIYIMASGEIRKVHIRLIRRFNGKIVL